MIRLNDTYKTVIDEKEIKVYSEYKDNMFDKEIEAISLLVGKTHINFRYDSKEARDKDIELLDKLFDVKSIEDKAMSVAKPELYSNEGGINEESKPVKEETITWDYVKQFECGVNAYLPEGSICNAYYEEDNDRIQLDVGRGYIYDEDLFNSLKLKKVE